VRTSVGRVARLLDGTLGHNGCRAFRFFEFLARQGMQVLKILLPNSEEVPFRKEERTCFWRHEEQYFESIAEARGKEVEEERRAGRRVGYREGMCRRVL
jgi:hypothetical protein